MYYVFYSQKCYYKCYVKFDLKSSLMLTKYNLCKTPYIKIYIIIMEKY